MKIGRLLLRAAVGGFFIGHGTQKLFGWFGGQGLKNQAEHFEGMGLKPGMVNAAAAGAAETLGGAGILLGYRTPLASAGIVSVMLTAIDRVHLKNGPWAHKGGYEYNVVLAAAAVSLAESGPGGLSLDALRGKERTGARWGLLSLLLGAGGAAGARALSEWRATPEPVAAPSAPAAAASVNGSDPAAGEAEPAATTATAVDEDAEQGNADNGAPEYGSSDSGDAEYGSTDDGGAESGSEAAEA
jgi:putative oxidoreductase